MHKIEFLPQKKINRRERERDRKDARCTGQKRIFSDRLRKWVQKVLKKVVCFFFVAGFEGLGKTLGMQILAVFCEVSAELLLALL